MKRGLNIERPDFDAHLLIFFAQGFQFVPDLADGGRFKFDPLGEVLAEASEFEFERHHPPEGKKGTKEAEAQTEHEGMEKKLEVQEGRRGLHDGTKKSVGTTHYFRGRADDLVLLIKENDGRLVHGGLFGSELAEVHDG